MPLTILANVHAAAGKADLVGAELHKLVEPTRREAGYIRYDLHRDTGNPAHFMFYETWESRDEWQAHMSAPHLAAYMAATDGAVAQFDLNEMQQIA